MKTTSIMLAAAASFLAGTPAHAWGVADMDRAAVTANRISMYGLSSTYTAGQDHSLRSALSPVEQNAMQQWQIYPYSPGQPSYVYWPYSYSYPTYSPYVYVLPYYYLTW